MEQLNLTTPIARPSTTNYKVTYLCLDWKNERITVELTGDDDSVLRHSYERNEASILMIQLNKANLASNSLHKRIINQLLADGILQGTVAGTPD